MEVSHGSLIKFVPPPITEKDYLIKQYKLRVKMHRVSLSRESFIASSR